MTNDCPVENISDDNQLVLILIACVMMISLQSRLTVLIMYYLWLPIVPSMQHLQLLAVVHEKRNIKDRLKREFMNKKAKEEEENKSVITKFLKITYFFS